jgi:hypothetical protein
MNCDRNFGDRYQCAIVILDYEVRSHFWHIYQCAIVILDYESAIAILEIDTSVRSYCFSLDTSFALSSCHSSIDFLVFD